MRKADPDVLHGLDADRGREAWRDVIPLGEWVRDSSRWMYDNSNLKIKKTFRHIIFTWIPATLLQDANKTESVTISDPQFSHINTIKV